MRRGAMSSRERLRAALASKPTDRVAWSPCVDGYFLSSLPENQKLDEVHTEAGSLDGFIVGTGDALPKNTPLPNLHAITQAVRNYALD